MPTEMDTIVELDLPPMPQSWMKITDRSHKYYGRIGQLDKRKPISTETVRGDILYSLVLDDGTPTDVWGRQMRSTQRTKT